MQQIVLGNTGIRSPQLGFGCSAVMGRSGKAGSLRALSAAWEEGIRFFDTARAYGYGESEALLGEFLQGRRDQAVIATKFGILPARKALWKEAAKSVARKILAVAPSARPILQKGAASQFSHNQFTVPVLEQSVEESLRKLRTGYVDFLFLHAAPASVLEQQDLLAAMAKLVAAGKVRVAGLSAEPEVVAIATQRSVFPLRAMQFPCNVFNLSAMESDKQAIGGGFVCVANQPFGGTAKVQMCRAILRKIAANSLADPALREKLGDLDDSIFADVVLNVILRGMGIHVVIPAMMKVEHIRANVRVVAHSRFDSQEIGELHRLLSAAVA
jgi:aryl-alcohol dehydrogenase-like predicted oxidoreductase